VAASVEYTALEQLVICRDRLQRAQMRQVGEALLSAGQTQRQVAAALGVARSTFQDWQRASAGEAVPAGLAEFIATSEGIQWLRRIVVAAHFAITLRGGAGIRVVCEFLELSGLSAFVGASYGTQQALNVALEAALVTLAEQQRTALAEGMAPRQVTVCEDETFHPAICLVALEPVSGFIFLEQYAEDRSAATWSQALQRALCGLPIEVIQGTSDEAKALRRHIEGDCHAQHSPDLFHCQHEVSKATALHLARQLKQAEARVVAADAHWQAERAGEQAYWRQPRRPRGRPPAFAQRIQAAVEDLTRAEAEREQAQTRQCEARTLIRALGELYHPYSLQAGQAQPVAVLAQRFEDIWKRLGQLADAADLPTRAREHLAKAQRLTTQLLATMAFFFATVQTKVEALDLSPELHQVVIEQLIPAIYLERVATRSTRAESRHRLHALSARMLEPLRQATHPLQQLAPTSRACIEQVAGECADLFQRSSSAVEGRNGQLSLHHHGRHRLSDRKLAALSAVHNFHIRRADGTTAAQRLFGRDHAPLFEQVLERMPLPPPPRQRRAPRPRAPYLQPLAA
jgi:transcriptional regulator with XRE-family HTH domain